MVYLDGDVNKLKSGSITNNLCVRDIVQYICYHKIQDNRDELVKLTLEEFPKQLIQYFNNRNI